MIATLINRARCGSTNYVVSIRFAKISVCASVIETPRSNITTFAICAIRGIASDVHDIKLADITDRAIVVRANASHIATLVVRARGSDASGVPQT
jgi:hypothetical protein